MRKKLQIPQKTVTLQANFEKLVEVELNMKISLLKIARKKEVIKRLELEELAEMPQN